MTRPHPYLTHNMKTSMTTRFLPLPLLLTLGLASSLAMAQATVKTDDQWRYALGAGASFASGNTKSSTFNLNADAVQASSIDKWDINGRALYGRDNDTTVAEQMALGTRYDRNFTPDWFGFGQADVLRDKSANLSPRTSFSVGPGYHVIKTDPLTWDVYAGLGYVHDRFINPTVIDDALRSGYGHGELMLGETSTHKLTANTSFKQKLEIYPDLANSSHYRAAFDSGLAVAMNNNMSLTASLVVRYNSDPGLGFKTNDTLFVTGISVKLD